MPWAAVSGLLSMLMLRIPGAMMWLRRPAKPKYTPKPGWQVLGLLSTVVLRNPEAADAAAEAG